MSPDNQNFASFCNGKLLMWAKHKSRQTAVRWKEGKCQRGVRSRRSTKARRQALLISPGFLRLLYCCKAKYFLLYKSQHEACVQVLQLPCGPWKINYSWGDWWRKISGTVRVKEQDRVGGVGQEISAMASTERNQEDLLQRSDTTWGVFSQRAAKEIWAVPWGTDPAPKSKQGSPGDALQAEGDQGRDRVGVYITAKQKNSKPNALPPTALPTRKKRKEKGIIAGGHIVLYAPGRSSDTLVISTW